MEPSPAYVRGTFIRCIKLSVFSYFLSYWTNKFIVHLRKLKMIDTNV